MTEDLPPTPDALVGIVGAGPVGLACAARLAGFGITCVVLEAGPALRQEGSKACVIQGDVIEVLDKVGCGEQIATEGVTWHIARTYVRGQQIGMCDYPMPVGFGPFVNISQYRIEQIMVDALTQRPECAIRWSHPVTEVTQDDCGVTVVAGGKQMRFRYLVACDGVRSTLRELTGVKWTGTTYADQFLIADIQVKLPFAAERHFHYDPPFNPGRQLVMHAQPDNVWRIDWQLPPDSDITQEQRTGGMEARIRAVAGDVPYEIKWLSTYRFHQRVVENFVVGNIFFAGDAAHALPPYGARGMNSGIQDADNLAWKLACVLRGDARSELLATYHAERYAAALENLRVTSATIQFMVPKSAIRRRARTALLRAATALRPFAKYVDSGKMAEPFTYSDSPIIDESSGDPLAGVLAPDRAVLADGERSRLRRFFGAGFAVLHTASTVAAVSELAAAVASGITVANGAKTVSIPVNHLGLSPPSVAAAVDGSKAGVTVLADVDPGAAPYRQGHWYLIRPDGHVAAARPSTRLGDLPAILARCSGAAVSPADVRDDGVNPQLGQPRT